MLTVRRTTVIRYFAMCTGLAILIAVGRYLDVNPTAIALGFLIAGPAGDAVLPGAVKTGIVLMWIAAILTLYTGWDYMKASYDHV